jgi:hypothetical protein
LPAGIDRPVASNVQLRGRFLLRVLRARWSLMPPRRSRIRSAEKPADARMRNAAAIRFKLIDFTLQAVQQLKQAGPIPREGMASAPALIETVIDIVTSPSQLSRPEQPAMIEPGIEAGIEARIEARIEPVLVVPSAREGRHGDRRLVTSPTLETAITEAVKKGVPGCETFVGVIVERTKPKSRFDANWALRGVKFGRADRDKANLAISTIVERMQREFGLSDD